MTHERLMNGLASFNPEVMTREGRMELRGNLMARLATAEEEVHRWTDRMAELGDFDDTAQLEIQYCEYQDVEQA